ncbi:MAG TPA: GH3 auxin-responsive promoter family protein [Pyrinomonadaceae bacterium]|nr:GH3 auxin-responsive promoter family protein [Pyrinomonadaceae bacterium]
MVIARCIHVAGVAFIALQQFRLSRFRCNQERLARKYKRQLNPETEGKFAITSGSTGDPKRILYTTRRLRTFKLVFSDMFARACRVFRIDRTSLYVFSSFAPDESLTSLLLEEVDLPNYLATLQAPYRVQRHPAMCALAAEYGATAVRLWILTIANPGVLYSTNPSTLSTFFDELTNHWRESSALIRNWCKDGKRFNADVRKIARRLDSIGSKQRLEAIAGSEEPVPISGWAPALEAYICWTGGYVKPFLDRLQKYLPPTRYRLIPMFSMSTETVETLSYFQNNEVLFLPLAPGVVYEFLDAETERLLGPGDLEPGKTYEMIVSDEYGLRRYRTNDLFLCRRKINGLPDLAFVRRRGLAYSFTGEKLTAEQVSKVFEKLRSQYPIVFANNYLTCIPSLGVSGVPHYKLVVIGDRKLAASLDGLANRCDELLSEVNCEYRGKRTSGRLGAITLLAIGTREFAERFSPRGNWESQFKFLPLCPHLVAHDEERVS